MNEREYGEYRWGEEDRLDLDEMKLKTFFERLQPVRRGGKRERERAIRTFDNGRGITVEKQSELRRR